MSKKILFLLILGIVYKSVMTANGNFIFHIDSARDMVEVREMVVLKKLRLIGPTTAISGLFDGPVWYYSLAVPFIVSGGDPYASLIMQFIFWAVGGFFLLKIVGRWSEALVLPIGFLWIASDYVGLSTLYAFNPNPVILLSPLFIYLTGKYIETEKLIFVVSTAILAGLLFNFEMSFGIFIPFIILFSILFSKKIDILKSKRFWIGVFIFAIFLTPQLLFNFKHQFIMFNALNAHMQREGGKINLQSRFLSVFSSFYNLFIPVILNRKLLSLLLVLFSVPILLRFVRQNKKDSVVIVALCYVLIPFIGYLFLPITVSPWHLGGPMVGTIVLAGFVLRQLWLSNMGGKLISLVLCISILFFSLFNIFKFFIYDIKTPNMDPSLFKNEIAAIDYVYKYAKNKNFKVYTYLPSVIDYPYQYLIWWYGLKQFGYLPADYAYAPNKFDYISNKAAFSATESALKARSNSNLVFLIKEPDRNYTRSGWEGEFINFEKVEKKMVGPLEIDIRKEINKQ